MGKRGKAVAERSVLITAPKIFAAVLAAALTFGVLDRVSAASSPASEPAKPHVACWNTYFPFESEGPDLLKRPKRCLIYKTTPRPTPRELYPRSGCDGAGEPARPTLVAA